MHPHHKIKQLLIDHWDGRLQREPIHVQVHPSTAAAAYRQDRNAIATVLLDREEFDTLEFRPRSATIDRAAEEVLIYHLRQRGDDGRVLNEAYAGYSQLNDRLVIATFAEPS